jgi:hypothetical protein
MAAGSHTSPGATAGPSAAIAILERLSTRLTADGWQVGMHAPPDRRPMLYVAHPAIVFLSELVTAEQGSDGRWWLWWSWAERIALADDLNEAAATIGRVLGSRDDTR